MSIILETKDLRKTYFGYGKKKEVALNGVNLKVESGIIFGLLGPKGSGKTTFLKMIAGLLKPSGGGFTVCGKEFGIETKRIVSFLPDKNIVYPWMTAADAIGFYADFVEDFDKAKASDMLNFMKLNPNQTVKTMSKGMVEKLNLTLTFSRASKLYILDEPLGGTDPVAREQIIKTIIKTWSEESAILITTHLVSDIEHIFNDVAFLRAGEVVFEGDAEDLRTTREKSIYQIYLEVFGS